MKGQLVYCTCRLLLKEQVGNWVVKGHIGCSAICIVSDSNHIVSMLKCMCSQNKVIHSLFL